MDKLSTIWNFIRRYKYGFVLCVFILLIGVVGEYSLWQRYKYKTELRHLRSSIRQYTEMYEHDTRYLEEMNTNPEIMTKIAREKYFMKTDDEDVFVIQKEGEDE